MSISKVSLEHRLSVSRSLANAIRRRIWRWSFAPRQAELGSFFLDPSDHIGAERIIMGDRYEGRLLALLGEVIDRLQLGRGCALDVGANIGNHACFFARRFRRVICVEPGKAASLVLEANLVLSGTSNYEIHRVALGREARSGVLDRIDQQNLGSSVVREVDGAGEFRIMRGDELLRGLDVHDLTLVKIDVEGSEIDVLDGLAEILDASKPMVCVEVLEAQRWETARNLLRASGYEEWFVVVPARIPRGFFGRVWATLRGQTLRLTPLADSFREGGYDMILCMTREHVMRLAG